MMLSLESSNAELIAVSETQPTLKIYMKAETGDQPELDTTKVNKLKIFTDYLKRDKKTSLKDIKELADSFEKGELTHSNPKLDRKYDNAMEFVNESLKHFLQYPSSTKLFPLINKKKEFTLYITGMRGSGKTYFVKQFLKYNRDKDRQVIFISPFLDDSSMNGVKDVIPMDIDEIEDELERPFTVADFPENSIIVYDDLEGFGKKKMAKLDDLRDKTLTMGRHNGLSVISICHNPMSGNRTKAPIRESQYFVLFPQSNPRDTKVLLQTYGGYTSEMIKEILNSGSRFVFVNKSAPRYWISSSQIRLL